MKDLRPAINSQMRLYLDLEAIDQSSGTNTDQHADAQVRQTNVISRAMETTNKLKRTENSPNDASFTLLHYTYTVTALVTMRINNFFTVRVRAPESAGLGDPRTQMRTKQTGASLGASSGYHHDH